MSKNESYEWERGDGFRSIRDFAASVLILLGKIPEFDEQRFPRYELGPAEAPCETEEDLSL